MVDSLFLSLHKGVSLKPEGTNQAVLQYGQSTVSFNQLTPGTLAALQQLGDTGEYEDRLTDIVIETDGIEALAGFYYCLNRLGQARLLRRSVHLNGTQLATLVPISPYFEFRSRNLTAGSRYLLSRFAYTHAEAGEMVLESPLSHARIILHDVRAATLVHALAQPGSVEELAEQTSSGAADGLLALLLNAGMVTALGENGNTLEDENAALRSWEFHDLLFHSRSRIGRHDQPVGGTYRLAGVIAAPPALKPARPGGAIALDRPDLERRRCEDPPFALVQEARRSIREYDIKPITLEQLGEFLYRVGRVTETWESKIETPRDSVTMDFARRPYAAGGALYEIELYATVNACENLGAGLYHYDPQNHRLERISGRSERVDELLLGASHATMIPKEKLQVLIILAGRFQRMAYKYASMAYAATLKHVGVLYQTMYLVATAMGLAPCGIGCGDADLFARAAHTDYYAETSVGEFLLGSRPPFPFGVRRHDAAV